MSVRQLHRLKQQGLRAAQVILAQPLFRVQPQDFRGAPARIAMASAFQSGLINLMQAQRDQDVLDHSQTLQVAVTEDAGVMPGPGLEQLHRMLVGMFEQQRL